MWKVYDKCMLKRDLQKVVRQSYDKSYDKMYDSSLAVVRQHQTCMQQYLDFSLVYNSHIMP